jgi:O-antigen/teichoic acid export membrane protein
LDDTGRHELSGDTMVAYPVPPNPSPHDPSRGPVGAEPMAGQAARGTALNLIGAAVTTITGFASVIVVTRRYGAEVAGVLFAGVGLWTLLGNAAKLGTESSLTWYVARTRAGGHRGSIVGVLRSAIAVVALCSTAVGLAAAMAAPWLANLLADTETNRDELVPLIVALSLTLPGWSVAQAAFGASRGFATMRPAVFWGQVVRPTLQTVLMIATMVFTAAPWALGLSWGLSSIAVLVPSLLWLHRRLRDVGEDGPDERAEFWAYTRPRALSDIIHATLERLDLLLVSALAGAAAAGAYLAGNRLILAGSMVLLALSQAVAPLVAGRLAKGEIDAAGRMVQTLTAWNILVLWPGLILLATGAGTIVDVFGDGFAGSASIVVVLALGLAVVAGLGPGDTVLLMTGDSRGSLLNHVVALVTMVVVSFALIPFFGAIGAAWAWTLSRIVLRASAVWRIERFTGMRCWGPPVTVAALVTVLAYVPASLIAGAMVASGLGALVVGALAGSALFAALVFILRDALAIDELLALIKRRR